MLPFLAFVLLNFLGLYIGGRFTGPGVTSSWYQTLDQAPWTPPGWVFGVAWTTVMIGFSWFMAGVWQGTSGEVKSRWMLAFAALWLLNVAWNPVFFVWHQLAAALVILVLLLLGVVAFAWASQNVNAAGSWRWGILPYLLWLLVATSLNVWYVLPSDA